MMVFHHWPRNNLMAVSMDFLSLLPYHWRMSEVAEKWVPTHRLEQWLEVSDQGRVRALVCYVRKGAHRRRCGGNILKQWCINGYLQVSIRRDGVTYWLKVHQAVARGFVPGFFDGATVDHLDGNKLNNVASNLEWVTSSENAKRMWAAGRGLPIGERHPVAKLPDEAIEQIFKMRAEGKTQRAIAEQMGLSENYVRQITTGRRRREQAAPFIAKYGAAAQVRWPSKTRNDPRKATS
jgi:hypothetical protein